MKQKCPTYLKSTSKGNALATTLSDTEPKADLEDSDQEGTFMAFTTTIESPKESEELVHEEEVLMELKFEKMDDKDDIQTAYTKLYKNSEKYEKLYKLATRKLIEVELKREKLSTKVDEANQTNGALWFENNFLAEKTKKLDAELFQVKAQLERASSAKLDEMLNFQKAAFDKTGLGYDHSLSSYSTSSSTLHNVIFVPPASNSKSKINECKIEIVSEDKNDKAKSILGAPPKIVMKETKQNNHHSNNKKSQPKKPHFCHHCEESGHTRPNCYKWLATQRSNSVSSFGSQNQLRNSLAPLGELLKATLFLTNLNGFNHHSYPPKQRSQKKKTYPPSKSPVWKEKDYFK